MLTLFSVSNFKNFNSKITLDLSNPNGYSFNNSSVKNGVIQHALIYGKNGVGKSNLGLAIFDIIGHLTDLEFDESNYKIYLNAFSKADVAKFHYEFQINTNKVTYQYEKTNHNTIVAEHFFFNEKKIISIDRKISNEAVINLKGTESLKKTIENDKLSVLKYIINNSILDRNIENKTFLKFFEFIDKMLFFKSLDHSIYIGLEIGHKYIEEDIIQNENVSNLESFLNKAGIECRLVEINYGDDTRIAFNFNGKLIPFIDVASTGTHSLTIVYFWLQRLKSEAKVSFLFIDEFDAFYHHELSEIVVEELKKTGVQFILTTHNTSIISNDLLRPDCYFQLDKGIIKSLAKSTNKELREAHNIEKMYKSGSFHVK